MPHCAVHCTCLWSTMPYLALRSRHPLIRRKGEIINEEFLPTTQQLHGIAPSHFNLLQQFPMLMSFFDLPLIVSLAPRVHTIIRALREAILPLSIMRDDGTINSTRVIGSDATDHDTVSSRWRSIVHASGYDGELQIGLGSMLEAEVLVVVVGVGILVSAWLLWVTGTIELLRVGQTEGLALGGEREGLFADVGVSILSSYKISRGSRKVSLLPQSLTCFRCCVGTLTQGIYIREAAALISAWE